MSEDHITPEEEVKVPEKVDHTSAIFKLVLLVGVLFSLVKWGLPLMDEMADQFKKKQGNGVIVANEDEVMNSDDVKSQVDMTANEGTSDEDKFKLAAEREINLWLEKQSPSSTAVVKYINTNSDQSKLAVEYVERSASGDELSKELIFYKDEFGIFIYKDENGARQIRIRKSE